MIDIRHGDCLVVLPTLAENSLDACVCDPPYHLTSIVKRFGKANSAPTKDHDGLYARASRGFMGKEWDGGDIAFRVETWEAVFRVLKPGAHLVAFSATRTYHRMACAIEDAGFEIRDQLAWMYGSGFPKSHDVSKGIDKMMGGYAPKYAYRPISCVIRKQLARAATAQTGLPGLGLRKLWRAATTKKTATSRRRLMLLSGTDGVRR